MSIMQVCVNMSSSCGRVDRLGGYITLSTDLLTYYHHNSILKLSVRCCVWKVVERFPGQV